MLDVLVIGAGPAGLYAAYYAGFRGLSVGVMDSLPELGGQVSALYPEKLIYDVAGFPAIKGRDLVDALAEQAATASPTYFLGERAQELQHDEGSVTVTTDQGREVHARTVLITGGIGTFTPRRLPAGHEFEGRGLMYFVPKPDDLAGLDVLVVGGGDSAFDWALCLEPQARSVTLAHRRTVFRAHERTVLEVRKSSTRMLTPFEVERVHGNGSVSAVDLVSCEGDVREQVEVQVVVAALGFTADLGPFTRWGLVLEKRRILVDSRMRTNLPRVLAAGDVTEYDGKVRLISVGFGEAATAVNNAVAVIDPGAKVAPGHSSDPGTKKRSARAAAGR